MGERDTLDDGQIESVRILQNLYILIFTKRSCKSVRSNKITTYFKILFNITLLCKLKSPTVSYSAGLPNTFLYISYLLAFLIPLVHIRGHRCLPVFVLLSTLVVTIALGGT